jgi:hypothetical protein
LVFVLVLKANCVAVSALVVAFRTAGNPGIVVLWVDAAKEPN